MIVVDAHQDIAYNALCFERDYLRAALRKRQQEAGTSVPQVAGKATTGWPEAVAGRVALICATVFTAPYSRQPAPWSPVMYRDAAEAHTLGLRQMDYYHRLADAGGKIRLVTTQADLDAVLATWEPGVSLAKRQQGLMLLMENADPIREPRELELWYERGLRVIGPAWQASRYAGGTGQPGPLTTAGRELLDAMLSFTMVLDLSHMAEVAFYQALEHYSGPVIASHSNPRRFCDTDRHLSDGMIRALAERGGVMGVVLANSFLQRGWVRGDGKAKVTLQTVIDVIDHVCQITGSAAHVGLGSDFDGGFGAESVPAEIDTVADLWRIAEALRDRGYAEADISAIMSGNMLRQLRAALA